MRLEDYVLHTVKRYHTLVCMGVLSHHRNPLTFLKQLSKLIKVNGHILIESIVMPGSGSKFLAIQDRYAGMPNCYKIPTLAQLKLWLNETGFSDISCLDVSETSTNEQRVTDYSSPVSLKDYLNPTNPTKTIEGYPRPQRAILIATWPKS